MDAVKPPSQKLDSRAQTRADQAARVAAKIALSQGASVAEALALQHRLRQTLASDTPTHTKKDSASVHCFVLAHSGKCSNCAACPVRPRPTL
ncbi:hypothetical protein ACJJIE_00070 (plasmid) [Microbulbifer sp. TRSA001]|uniref:hypothetical protein n=1 Tax=Microbulbifer sp. TRSA001 TaxID=3243381 RepID=UPI00403A1552